MSNQVSGVARREAIAEPLPPSKPNRPLSLGPLPKPQPAPPPATLDPQLLGDELAKLCENHERLIGEQAQAKQALKAAQDAVPLARRQDLSDLADASVRGEKATTVTAEAKARQAAETARRTLDAADLAVYRAGCAVGDYINKHRKTVVGSLDEAAASVDDEVLQLLDVVDERLAVRDHIRAHRMWAVKPVDGNDRLNMPNPRQWYVTVKRFLKPSGDFPTAADLIHGIRESLNPNHVPAKPLPLEGGLPPGSIKPAAGVGRKAAALFAEQASGRDGGRDD